ncbi:MAG: DNA-processing protein DprA [Bacteroidaceae bacterium]|nr:DNA-processing protein DprA [Bacteroidaceae bacterium]
MSNTQCQISNETLNCIALSMMFPQRGRQLLELYRRVGSATTVVENADHLQDIVPDLNPDVFMIDSGQLHVCLEKAKAEVDFAQKHTIQILTVNSEDYPMRLREVCPDAPLVLYYRGNANLNCSHIISIVGTRTSTQYGLDMVNSICRELANYFPELLIVSGLAYGTDINAHRAALEYGMPTVAVLAHGLDHIYPSVHRNTAQRMMEHGGLITEFPSSTKMEPTYFLRRNRIIAGLAEATLVVESKERGGALSTARMANDYNLTVMACPGRATDPASMGCNNLIASNSAALVTSAADIVKALNWAVPKRKCPTLPSLFEGNLSAEEKIVYDKLGSEPQHFSLIVTATGLSVPIVLSVLNELEFRGIIRQLPGSKWRKI